MCSPVPLYLLSHIRQFQGLEDVLTVLVSFDRDALDVNPGRGSVTMPERVLGFTEGPRALGHHPREGMARLVQMNLADPRCKFSEKSLNVFT